MGCDGSAEELMTETWMKFEVITMKKIVEESGKKFDGTMNKLKRN